MDKCAHTHAISLPVFPSIHIFFLPSLLHPMDSWRPHVPNSIYLRQLYDAAVKLQSEISGLTTASAEFKVCIASFLFLFFSFFLSPQQCAKECMTQEFYFATSQPSQHSNHGSLRIKKLKRTLRLQQTCAGSSPCSAMENHLQSTALHR